MQAALFDPKTCTFVQKHPSYCGKWNPNSETPWDSKTGFCNVEILLALDERPLCVGVADRGEV